MAKLIQVKTKGGYLVDHELIDVPVTSLDWFGGGSFTINFNDEFHLELTEDDVEWLLSRMKPRNLISRKISDKILSNKRR
tara:strand:- start:44 stop:283 length:240 start_codon:yes stop_codon:yes gene_type:complete